jgi:hypothetical protein
MGCMTVSLMRGVGAGLLVTVLLGGAAQAQRRPMDIPDTTQKDAPQQGRTRLYLTDGTYQLVLSYKVVGKVVRYRSAERNGEVEEIPLSLVDMTATAKWASGHEAGSTEQQDRQVVLSPELAKEEAARVARTPEIATNLHLPEEDSVLVLDTFEGTPELIPLPQQGSDLNKETAHAVLKTAINPASTAHRIGSLPGPTADVQLHVEEPVFYVRVGQDDEGDTGGGTITVDTHGASGRATPDGGAEASEYVIERLDPRQDARIVDSFRIAMLDSNAKQRDVIEMNGELLPGGKWVKLTPKERLDFGEYALVEVLSAQAVNLNVWDFGVHSAAAENVEAIRPEAPRPAALERRQLDPQ